MLIQKKLNRDAGKLRLRLKQAFSLLFACLMILQTGVVTAFAAPSASVIRSDELRGVWISYLDWERLPADQESFKHEVDKMLDRCLELKMQYLCMCARMRMPCIRPHIFRGPVL